MADAIHKIQTNAGEITIRLYAEQDIPYQASYMFDSPTEFLEEIGFDPAKFASRDTWIESRRIRIADLRSQGKEVPIAVGELCGKTIAQVVVNLESSDHIPRFHFHILDPSYRGRGLGGPIFLAGLQLLRKVHSVGIAYIEPKATNLRMNALMKKLGFRYLGNFEVEVGPMTQQMLTSRYEIPLQIPDYE